jgi:O-antigen/teichoic acid export membrane protein
MDYEETSVERPSRRKRAGRVVFFIGLSLVLVAIILSFSISIVSAYSGTEIPISSYSDITALIFIIGLVLIIAGLTAIILPEGLSKDETWIMKMSPYAGNN